MDQLKKEVYRIDSIYKEFKKGKKVANSNISFSIRQGEIFGLLGPNGAGKSTLIKQMVGQIKPTSGTIYLYDQDVLKDSYFVMNNVAYYSQETFALHKLKVYEAIYFTARLRGIRKQAAKNETEELLQTLGLDELRNMYVKNLSGGQKRMVGFAACLTGKLPVLILDEPTNDLDPLKRNLIWNLLQKKNREEGTTIILVTHNLLEAEKIVDRVAVINQGKVLAIDYVGRLKQLVDQRYKLEITSVFGENDIHQANLSKYGEIQSLTENRFRVLIQKEKLTSVIGEIIEYLEMVKCEEYRIIPPSLEDVYLHYEERD
ncbi:ABC transporter ATP-binding protein [Bacillus aquiflavi]|uniref:ABC transporter ATP-binding protein n=1 Tax=Bacillus aquiflavi TaxID=2672567 RepID=A0A6B3VXZ7_9BACI|nr:ABC transporter ATP-binding protein [Bacillus aquiflavi]MBA4536820.1 ABC transporter ATP-binding protein [Bacillus aquiflavi]NEY81187.1 ABC transporter ATP-binding protein [Bacillus aquiflavi]UAC49748.1 ABC transporter ATP-binding protein [Bacillus aquiflavi]